MPGHPSPLTSVLKGKTDLKASKQFWSVLAAGLGLLLVRLWPIQYEGVWAAEYGGWQHLVLEFLTVSMAFSVFYIGWHVGIRRQTLRGLTYSVTFLSIGVLGLLHMLSLPNMPSFITPNSLNKAVLFSYTSHLVSSICLLRASFLPVRRISRLTRTCYLAASLLLTSLATLIILVYENYLPQVFVGSKPVRRTTTLIALVAAGLSLLLFVRFNVTYRKAHKESYRYIKAGGGMWVLSQVSFLCLGNGFHTYNLIGHIYRAVAYGYICHGVLSLTVQRPYDALDRAREQLRRTRQYRTLGRIVGRLAHELKNPLAAIRASAQLSTILDDQTERGRVNQRIQAEVDRLSDLITMTLEVGWERRQIWDLVHLDQIAEEVCSLWEAELRILSITSKVCVQDELPPIQGNPKLLQRALTNLVLNAVEAMPGGGELGISIYQEAEGSSIRVEISDTGPGIPDELRDRLFREFTTTKPHGTGMGLMITHQIITEIHRGQIWFSTVLGEGTSFFIRLPVTQTK